MLWINYFRDNLVRLLSGDEKQQHGKEGKTLGHDGKSKKSNLSLWNGYYELVCDDENLDGTSIESLSTSSSRSDGSDEHYSLHLDTEIPSSKRRRKECSLMSIDVEESSAIACERSKKLPGTWYFSSNHIMINTERTKNNIHPLIRKSELDAAARWHAEAMALVDRVHHSDPQEMKNVIRKPCRRLGENIARGENIRAIHSRMMETPNDKANMLDARYIQFGMGTARGPNGDLFLCQLYRG